MADLTGQPNQHDIAATTLSLIKNNLARISRRLLKITIGGLVELIDLLLEEANRSDDELKMLNTQLEKFSGVVSHIAHDEKGMLVDTLETFSSDIHPAIESCYSILLSRMSSGSTIGVTDTPLTVMIEAIYEAVSNFWLPISPRQGAQMSPAGAKWPNNMFTHSGCVSSIAILSGGHTIATGSWDKSVYLWDTWKGKPIIGFKPWSPPSEEVSVVFTNGSHVISGTFDGCICVWEKEYVPGGKPSWKRIAVLRGHSDSISSIASSGRWKLVSGSWDNTVRVWSYDGRLLATLQGHEGVISSVAASKYGAFIISGSSDQTIRVWDAYNYSLLTSLALNNAKTITSLSFCWDGSIISVHENDQIQQWSLPTMQMKMEQRGKLGSLRQLSCSRDFSVAISIGQNCRYLQIWNLSIGTSEVASTRLVKLEDLEPSISSECTAVAISEDGTYAVLGYSDGKIAKVSMETAMSRVDRTRTIEEVPSSSSGYSTLAILRGPSQLLSQLEETAYDVKYCVQQVLRSLRDARSLITQLDFLFRDIHTSPSQGNSDQALNLADDVVRLGRWLMQIEPILQEMSQTTRPNLPSLIENLSTMQNLVYWVHQRPYYKEIHQDWAQRYNDAARFDIDKLIEQLAEVILSTRITSSQVASSSRIAVTPLASRVEGKEGVTKAKPLEAMDKFELLGEVLRSFKWSRKLTDFERAIMLEAVADMRYYWHPKGRPDDFNPREILSNVKKQIEDAPTEPALARNRVVEVRSQLYGNSMGQVVSSLEVFDLLQDRSSGFRPDSLSDFEQLRISDDP